MAWVVGPGGPVPPPGLLRRAVAPVLSRLPPFAVVARKEVPEHEARTYPCGRQ